MPTTCRVIVVGPTWVGDMVMAQAMFAKLRRLYPVEELHVLAPSSTLALTSMMPEIDQGIAMSVDHGKLGLARRWQVARQLSDRSYDWAIVTPRSLKSALVPFLAKIPRRTGFLGEMRYGLINDIRPEPPERTFRTVDRLLSLVADIEDPGTRPSPIPRLVVSEKQVEEALAVVGLSRPSTPILVLCPGSISGPARRWPTRHFASLAAEQQRKGWSVWVLGSNNDREVGNQICEHGGSHCHNLAGLTTVNQAAALITLCDAVVSNDSGLMHVGAALQKQTIGLFGSSHPERTPPLTDRGVALWLGLPCSPCFERQCPLGHLDCLNQLTPDLVINEFERDREPYCGY